MANFYKKSQSGRSMIEMLGVLAIIGVLSIGGIAGYTKAMEKHNINKAMDQISLIIAQVRTTFSRSQGGAQGYQGLEQYADEIIKSALGNDSMAGGYKIVLGLSALNEKVFFITMNNVGQSACVSLATANWGDKQSSGLQSMRIGNPAKYVPDFFDFPVALDKAADICSGCNATQGNRNCSITWYFQ